MAMISEPLQPSRYRWLVLFLGTMTFTLAVALPFGCLPVLIKEISVELDLNLVQIGFVMGTASVGGIATSLIGGTLGDRFGAQRLIAIGCLLSALIGAARGLATGYGSLVLSVFLYSVLMPAIALNVHKVLGIWFSSARLGMANGVVSSGMAFGNVITAMVSATLLSPLLGGWRQVIFLYGGISLAIGLVWIFVRPSPEWSGRRGPKGPPPVTIREALAHISRRRGVWVLSIAMLGMGGSTTGMLSYLPLYLRESGWAAVSADGALATYHAVSLLAAVPIASLSDRIGSRKGLMVGAAFLLGLGLVLLASGNLALVWPAVFIAGISWDGFMAMLMTSIVEMEGVGPKYAGTAMGLVITHSRIGAFVAPPAGNSLARFGLNVPFVLWAALAAIAMAGLALRRESPLRQAAQEAV